MLIQPRFFVFVIFSIQIFFHIAIKLKKREIYKKSKMVKSGIKVDETLKNLYNSFHLGKINGFKFTIEGSKYVVDESSILPKDHQTPDF